MRRQYLHVITITSGCNRVEAVGVWLSVFRIDT